MHHHPTAFPSRRRATLIACAALATAVGLLASGCSSTRTVSMASLQPAAVGFAPDARRIVIVDRSGSADTHAGVVESILTGESPEEDLAGVDALIESLRDQLRHAGRFETVVSAERLPGAATGPAFPPWLDWGRADQLAHTHRADLILCIEVFDSDFLVTRGRRVVTKTVTENNQRREIEVPEFHAEGVSRVTIGIRIYDPRRRDVVDQELIQRSRRWEASAATVAEALAALVDKAEATRHLGHAVGTDYACKISPMPTRVSRTFYGRSKRVPELEAGGRHADIADWEGAIAVWESGLARAPHREAGQLCFNIAVAHEVLGDWEKARLWAERAYVEYADDKAHDYLGALRRRVDREAIAAAQMEQSPP